MTELAQTYLGNSIEDATLAERIEKARSSGRCLDVHISQSDSRKGRIHAHTTSGVTVGIVKSRDWSLRDGDVLETEQGRLLLVNLQEQKVIVLRFTEPVLDRAIALIHLGHVLGNHHWPIIVQERKLYVELAVDAEVIESTIREFQIPGLQIDYELRSPNDYLDFSEHKHHHHG
jgi:urease accessory protein